MYLKNLNKSILFRISSDDYDKLISIADSTNLSLSQLLRLIIKQFLGGGDFGNFETN